MRVGAKLGRYELREQLGKGAAGTVFRARDALLGIDVCVKILHSGLATQAGIIERFKRELLLARRVAHPGICKIFDIQQSGDTHFLTMEYVPGETLSTILNRDGRMEISAAVRLMRKVSEALGAAHKAGVVHRDVKPGNIIIGDDGRVTIVDFGVATAEDLDRLTRAGVVLGSRSYMAPETWQGKPATATGDVWALGVILYGCVTGRLPYKGEGVIGVFEAIKTSKPIPPSALNPEVTPALEALIFKAMCIDVERRFQDASAVESALATLELSLSDGASLTEVLTPAALMPPEERTMAEVGKPPAEDERLRRPSVEPLPLPSDAELPATRELRALTSGRPTVQTRPISDEMSLYAAKERSGAGNSVLSSEQQEPTSLVGPFPELAHNEPLSETVADAFDEAFSVGEATVAVPAGDEEPAPARAFDTVLSTPIVPPVTDVVEEEEVLAALVGRELSDGELPRSDTALSEAPLSLFDGSLESALDPSRSLEGTRLDDDYAFTSHEATRVESPTALTEPVSRSNEDGFAGSVSTARAGPDKRLLAAAAAVLVAMIAGLFLALGGEDEEPLVAAVKVSPLVEAERALATAGSAVGDETAEEEPAAVVAEGEGVEELEAAEDEGSDEEGDESGELAESEGESADEELAEDDAEPDLDEDVEALAAASAVEEVSRPARVKPRKQRPSPQAVARAKYQRKRVALNAALAKKGVLPGDVAAVDEKRRQMTQAVQRRDYARASDAADETLRALSSVKIDATFVGKKLARFNQGYDRTTDEALRERLKGVLKDVGSDYSAARYEAANQKLNRAFSLMRKSP